MSRGERRELRWTDDSGTEHVNRWRVKLPPSPAATPLSQHLVTVHDPARHLVAVLADLGSDVPPVLIARGSAPVLMMMVLDGRRLAGAMQWRADDGAWMVSTLGDPQPESLRMRCDSCPGRYVVAGTDLWDALARRPTTRRNPRVTARRVA